MKNLLRKALSYFARAAILCFSTVVCYWLLYPYNIIDVHSVTILNPGKTVKQGGVLTYAVDFEKFKDIQGVVSKQLINTFRIPYSDVAGIAPAGPRRTSYTGIPIPAYASPGKYYLIWSVRHVVNPLRTVVETTWSDEFEITANDELKGEKGDKGIKGDDGDTGHVGPKGEPGKPGEKGQKGNNFWNSKDCSEVISNLTSIG